MAHKRKIRSSSAIAGATLTLVGIAGWVPSNIRRLGAQASTQIEPPGLTRFKLCSTHRIWSVKSLMFCVALHCSKPLNGSAERHGL
jgi:hypothetical protein